MDEVEGETPLKSVEASAGDVIVDVEASVNMIVNREGEVEQLDMAVSVNLEIPFVSQIDDCSKLCEETVSDSTLKTCRQLAEKKQ